MEKVQRHRHITLGSNMQNIKPMLVLSLVISSQFDKLHAHLNIASKRSVMNCHKLIAYCLCIHPLIHVIQLLFLCDIY